MSCSCVYIDFDFDPAEFCHSKDRRARKTHTCSECAREILAGERYEHTYGKWDGKISVFKTCVDCRSIRDSFFCDGWAYGCLWDLLTEHLLALNGEIASSCLDDLTPTARTQVCEQIQEIWGDIDG